MSEKTCVAIRHVAFEGLDAFEPVLAERGYAIRYVDIGRDDPAGPALDGADLLVVLGGPIGAYEDAAYPVLADELAAIERRLKSGRPLMGICLGAQLIARALGATVRPMGRKEIGFAPIALTEAGKASCLAPFEAAPLTLHWHGDSFDLPDGAVHLASSAVCENQAFAYGPNVIAFQFHPEAGADGFEPWLIGHAAELAGVGIDVAALRLDAARHGPDLARKAGAVSQTWLDGVEAAGRGR